MLNTLIISAKSGNQDAMLQLITRFQPLLKKRARLLHYEDSYNDLITLFIESVYRINPEKIYGKNDGTMVNYIAKSIYHSYCRLVSQAVMLNKTPCNLEDMSNPQLYALSAYNEMMYQELDFPKGLLTRYEEKILLLIYEQGFSVSDIAHNFQTSRQAINQCKLRAEAKLRSYYTASTSDK